MEVRNQIDRIIAVRKEKGEALKKRKTAIQEMKAVLKDSYSAIMAQTRGIQDEKLRKQYLEAFAALDSREVQKLADQLIRSLDNGVARFSRDYISIATVGKEGQGKSQFLQSVGDLDNSIIPAYDATSCTGATSIIWNASDMQKGTVRATITFRQPHELLAIVEPYIQEIDPAYLKNHPLVFEEISYIDVPQLSAMVETGNADQATALKHLTNIVEHFDEIRDLFGSSPISLTDPELIKTYVAQNNGKKIDDPDAEFYYKYLAVARADVSCPFFTDMGRVRLVDTVGIGATQYGIEDAMLATVDRECDAAIVVTRPERSLQKSDIDLYNSLRNRFAQRDTSKWLFYLVNLHVNRNDKIVDVFRNDILKANWAVADCRVVDSSDQTAVRDQFVAPMLKTLLDNMDDIDGAYMKEIDEKESAVWNALRTFMGRLPSLEKINTAGMLGMEALEKGKRCFDRMTAELSEIVSYWSSEREKPNTALWNSVQDILNNLDQIIPSVEKIDAISKNNGALTGEGVWETVLHSVRTEITDRFIALDDLLEQETLAFKNSLVRTLYLELHQLLPNNEPAQDGDGDMMEWLKTMMDNVLSSNERYAQIRKGFDFLYRFEFNTRAQLIREVRQQMYIINPACAEYAKPTQTFQKNNCANAVHFYLTSRMSVIEDELRYHLSKLYRAPNQAFYAAAEEFYDRLTFASDMSGDHLIAMSDVWGFFFQEFSSRLWKENAERFDAVNQAVEQYQQMITKLNACLANV